MNTSKSALNCQKKRVTGSVILYIIFLSLCRWPLEGKDSEYYFLQEQVSEYLDIKSFKRRYPDVNRRNVDHEERDFLVEMGVVTVTQVTHKKEIFKEKKIF